MATQWQTFPIQFGGGLISNLSPLQHGMSNIGSGSILQNFEPTLDGGYKKVAGYSKLISTVLPGSGVVQGVAVVTEEGSQKVIAVRNGVYYLTDASAGSPTWTAKVTASDTNISKIRHLTYNFGGANRIMFVDGVNYPAYYDFTSGAITYLSGSAASSVNNASFVTIYKESLVFAVGKTVVFSAPFKDNEFLEALSMGSTVTGLAVFRDNLIIFCEDKIHKLTGLLAAGNPPANQVITDDIGCIEPDSIHEVGGDVIFLAPDGIRTISATDRIGDFGLDVASRPIRSTLNDQLATGTQVTSHIIREKAQYRIFQYTSNERSSVAKGLLATKFIDQGGQGFQWAELKGFKVYVCDSNFIGDTELIVFSNEDGYVYKQETGTSRNGASIDAIFESAYMPINDPQVRKTFYKLDLYLKPEGTLSLTAGIKLDRNDANVIQPPVFTITGTGGGAIYGSTSAIYNTSVYSTPTDETYKTNLVGSGATVALRIEDNSSNPSFTLDTAVLEYTIEDRQ